MTDADQYVALGTTVGHEISHAFDLTGAQYGAYGQCESVFTDDDIEAFTKKCDHFASYYSSIEVIDGTFVDGQNVVGEATADLAGMQVALALAKETDRFDYERFCQVYAHVWAAWSSRTCAPRGAREHAPDRQPPRERVLADM